MLTRQRKLWLAAAALFVLVALASLLIPFYVEICEKDAYTGQKECAAHHLAVSLLLYIGQVLEAHAGTITGVATAVLAVITWRIVTLGKEQSETTRAQLRAYLSVVVGTAIYQERSKDLMFEAKPSILNNGQTPAYNVRYSAKAEILSDSVAASYIFREPSAAPQSQSSIGPRENRLMGVLLGYHVADSEIQDILDGKGKALWVWGIVYYDDVFRRPHFTQFCQRITWLKDRSNIYGNYDGRFGLSN
jgi:hypothetical protein